MSLAIYISYYEKRKKNSCLSSGFRREVDKICALLGCYAEYRRFGTTIFKGQEIQEFKDFFYP